MKMIYDDREEKYKYTFSVGELYDFGCSVLKDCMSPFDDVFGRAVELKLEELVNISSWAIGASRGSYGTIEEVKKDFLSWYGVNTGREG